MGGGRRRGRGEERGGREALPDLGKGGHRAEVSGRRCGLCPNRRRDVGEGPRCRRVCRRAGWSNPGRVGSRRAQRSTDPLLLPLPAPGRCAGRQRVIRRARAQARAGAAGRRVWPMTGRDGRPSLLLVPEPRVAVSSLAARKIRARDGGRSPNSSRPFPEHRRRPCAARAESARKPRRRRAPPSTSAKPGPRSQAGAPRAKLSHDGVVMFGAVRDAQRRSERPRRRGTGAAIAAGNGPAAVAPVSVRALRADATRRTLRSLRGHKCRESSSRQVCGCECSRSPHRREEKGRGRANPSHTHLALAQVKQRAARATSALAADRGMAVGRAIGSANRGEKNRRSKSVCADVGTSSRRGFVQTREGGGEGRGGRLVAQPARDWRAQVARRVRECAGCRGIAGCRAVRADAEISHEAARDLRPRATTHARAPRRSGRAARGEKRASLARRWSAPRGGERSAGSQIRPLAQTAPPQLTSGGDSNGAQRRMSPPIPLAAPFGGERAICDSAPKVRKPHPAPPCRRGRGRAREGGGAREPSICQMGGRSVRSAPARDTGRTPAQAGASGSDGGRAWAFRGRHAVRRIRAAPNGGGTVSATGELAGRATGTGGRDGRRGGRDDRRRPEAQARASPLERLFPARSAHGPRHARAARVGRARAREPSRQPSARPTEPCQGRAHLARAPLYRRRPDPTSSRRHPLTHRRPRVPLCRRRCRLASHFKLPDGARRRSSCC